MVVEVAVPLPVFGRFSWIAPRPLPPGASVVVPYGSRELTGWVVGPGEQPAGVELKRVLTVVSEEPAFTLEQLAFYQWMSSYYLAPLGEVVAAATPAQTAATTRRTFSATPEGVERLALAPPEGPRGSVLREVVARPALTRGALERRLYGEVADVATHLGALVQAALVRGTDVLVEGVRDQVLWIVGNDAAGASTPRGNEVLSRLPCLNSALPPGVVGTLLKRGLVRKEWRSRETSRGPLPPPSRPPPLNAAQVAVVAGVGTAGVYLLHGVTGSGKTEVYLSLAASVIASGRQVLVMVPEIALTPLLTSRFEGRFPGKIAVLHSGLAAGERLREWRRIQTGEASVVVGARSAVFAPFAALGLVVVDEEHDDSYKQDEGVRYHGRDLAVVRASRARCACVLGSATPSLESWRNAELGRYTLLHLSERATPSPVPTLELVDMRRAAKGLLLAPEVQGAVTEALNAGGKAILLYNRRGYATFVECPGCGGSYDCPSCGVSLVYHQAINRMDCHYCGFHRIFPGTCPGCATPLALLGRGTERIEELLAEAFAGVPVGRMDADTTRGKGGHARILDDFAAGRTRLLIGTQLVAKGHDFPDVTVAAVLGADHMLGMPDFRSAERTWALVTQLCGRAGRGAVAGRVFVQTRHPDHPIFSTIGDMSAFAEGELELRRMLAYPPYSGLVLVRLEAADRQVARESATAFVREAKAQARAFPGVDVLGPAAAPLSKLVGRYRFQAVIRGRDRKVLRAFLAANHATWKPVAGVRRIVDVDPRSMM